MDRDGRVIAHLDARLPEGLVLDIGAGDGFTASALTTPRRSVVALEPDPGMIDLERPLVWARGVAQDIPFHTDSFDAAYATWAFFFEGQADREAGLAEARRVVKPGGLFFMVDNAGDDEFTALSPRPLASDPAWWLERGFERTIVETSFRFDSVREATELLTFYFGDRAEGFDRTEIGYRVAVYSARVPDSP